MFDNNPDYTYVNIVWASQNRTFYVYLNNKTGEQVFEETITGEILNKLDYSY